jgi:drug/metabolite transporter (DMT)-like permease
MTMENHATSPAVAPGGPENGPLAGRAAPSVRRLGFLALTALSLIWGCNMVVMKIGLRYSQPFTFAALRTFLGATSLFVLLLFLHRPIRPKAFGLTLIVGIFQATDIGLVMCALVRGGAGQTQVLNYTMPFWLLLMAWVFLGERLQRAQWLAVGLAFVGLILVVRPWRLHGTMSSLLAVGAGVAWAASAIVAKLIYERRDIDLLSFTAWQMLLGSLPLLVVAMLTWHSAPVWSGSFVCSLAYNVLLANALAWLLWFYALRALPAGDAGLATLAILLIGLAAAWVFLGERPVPVEAVGITLIIGAVSITTLRETGAG